MKKYLLFYISFIVAFSSCQKDKTSPVLDDVDVRLADSLAQYQSTLASAPYGWKAYLLTNIDIAVDFTMKFNDKNRVVMTAEYGADEEESSYRLKALQRPTLLFDTYSILHELSDPNPNVLGGGVGTGYKADFEFALISATKDKILLEGTFNKSKLILIRAESKDDLESTYNNTSSMQGKLSQIHTYFKRTEIGGKNYEAKIDVGNKRINFISAETGDNVGSNFYVVKNEVKFFNPIVIGADSIVSLSNVKYDPSGFLSASSGALNLKITESITPMNYDKTAVTRFWRSDRQISFSAWVKDGQEDYLNDNSVSLGTGMNRRIAWLDYGPGYDLLGYAQGNSLYFGTAIASTIDLQTGLIKYQYVGALGTIPAAYRNIILQTALDFTDPKGLYVIETALGQYDLVTVSDARKWISFGQ
ncbi:MULTISPECIES: DUF4302 domain-containing protein [unclassified Sphingobacterium]|uniref:DUF4302 domain-containing protein n=1 Tax=unclassified Sphingobacterium TaxID=2609468 RepID=UPI0025E761F9|nr:MULTISPECIES: DUF4302 domain-containing protein [unclassified Sphingobacterium]